MRHFVPEYNAATEFYNQAWQQPHHQKKQIKQIKIKMLIPW